MDDAPSRVHAIDSTPAVWPTHYMFRRECPNPSHATTPYNIGGLLVHRCDADMCRIVVAWHTVKLVQLHLTRWPNINGWHAWPDLDVCTHA